MSKEKVLQLIEMNYYELIEWYNSPERTVESFQKLLKDALIEVYTETKEGIETEVEDEPFFIEEEGGTVIYREYALDAVRNYTDQQIEALR